MKKVFTAAAIAGLVAVPSIAFAHHGADDTQTEAVNAAQEDQEDQNEQAEQNNAPVVTPAMPATRTTPAVPASVDHANQVRDNDEANEANEANNVNDDDDRATVGTNTVDNSVSGHHEDGSGSHRGRGGSDR